MDVPNSYVTLGPGRWPMPRHGRYFLAHEGELYRVRDELIARDYMCSLHLSRRAHVLLLRTPHSLLSLIEHFWTFNPKSVVVLHDRHLPDEVLWCVRITCDVEPIRGWQGCAATLGDVVLLPIGPDDTERLCEIFSSSERWRGSSLVTTWQPYARITVRAHVEHMQLEQVRAPLDETERSTNVVFFARMWQQLSDVLFLSDGRGDVARAPPSLALRRVGRGAKRRLENMQLRARMDEFRSSGALARSKYAFRMSTARSRERAPLVDSVPHDVVAHIVEGVVRQCLHTTFGAHQMWQRVRAVSRTFRDEVDAATVRWTRTVLRLADDMHVALSRAFDGGGDASCCLQRLVDSLEGTGVSIVEVAAQRKLYAPCVESELTDRDVLVVYMRLRTHRCEGEPPSRRVRLVRRGASTSTAAPPPPPPPPPQRRSARLRGRLNRVQPVEAGDDGEGGCPTPPSYSATISLLHAM